MYFPTTLFPRDAINKNGNIELLCIANAINLYLIRNTYMHCVPEMTPAAILLHLETGTSPQKV